MTNYIIKVEGEIIANAHNHYVQNCVCHSLSKPIKDASIYNYDSQSHSVKGDLVLNEIRRGVPYAIYYTKKGICSTSTGSLYAGGKYLPALLYYQENIAQISNQLSIVIPKEIEASFYRGLFTDVFSILELFLSDILLCLIYTDGAIYQKATEFYKLRRENNVQEDARHLEAIVHKFFFEEVVYHKFDKVKKIFKGIIAEDFVFPDYQTLKKFLHRRNNIVHRYSFSNQDRMSLIIPTKEDIIELIKVTNTFANSLIDEIRRQLH